MKIIMKVFSVVAAVIIRNQVSLTTVNLLSVLRIERIEYANGNKLLFGFDFVFHLSGTSTNQSNIENEITGDRGLESEDTAHENVEIQFKVGDNCEHKRFFSFRNRMKMINEFGYYILQLFQFHIETKTA